MAEVERARDLADHLVKHPFDFTAPTPLIQAAEAIRDCAQALRQWELRNLANRLIAASKLDFSSVDGSWELKSTVARIVEVAAAVGRSSTSKLGAGNEDNVPLVYGTRWVEL
jgi:hypothetical protein